MGEFAKGMRKSRGLTLEQLAIVAGVSLSTVKKLEACVDRITLSDSTLDATLTALAQRAPLGASEIERLVSVSERRFESFELLNNRAEQLNREALRGPKPPLQHEPTDEERAIHAVHQLITAGQGPMLVAQLEAMVKVYSEQIAAEQRQDRHVRMLRVRHPERQVGDMVIEDTTEYEVTDDDEPNDTQSTSTRDGSS